MALYEQSELGTVWLAGERLNLIQRGIGRFDAMPDDLAAVLLVMHH